MMRNRLDDAITAYTLDRSDASLLALQEAFVTEELHVPVSEPVEQVMRCQYDVPVICVRTETGAGAIPSFTAMEHLLKWKPQGCLYTSLTGRSLVAMAIQMPAISEILVNMADAPRGRIPRGDFVRMLALPYG
jgi:SseB protein N-terminal domain